MTKFHAEFPDFMQNLETRE